MPAKSNVRKLRYAAQPHLSQTFADWYAENAAGLVLPLALKQDAVIWINSVLQSDGAMRGVENVSTLERVLKQHRTLLRYPTEMEFEKVLLTARLLFRLYEAGRVVMSNQY